MSSAENGRLVTVSEDERDILAAIAKTLQPILAQHLVAVVDRWDAAPADPGVVIFDALLAAEMRTPGMGGEPEPLHDLYMPDGCAMVRRNAVLAALVPDASQRPTDPV